MCRRLRNTCKEHFSMQHQAGVSCVSCVKSYMLKQIKRITKIENERLAIKSIITSKLLPCIIDEKQCLPRSMDNPLF